MKSNLIQYITMRISLEDMQVLKEQAKKRRLPVSTLCREKVTADIDHKQ